MTRINLVSPRVLSRQHLVAEYRELPRIYSLAVKNKDRIGRMKLPMRFCLGTGHMMFFVNKLQFIHRRHLALITEMLERGYNPSFSGNLPIAVRSLPSVVWGDYIPTEEDISLSMSRLLERDFDHYSTLGGRDSCQKR